jgi:hypothetical protein
MPDGRASRAPVGPVSHGRPADRAGAAGFSSAALRAGTCDAERTKQTARKESAARPQKARASGSARPRIVRRAVAVQPTRRHATRRARSAWPASRAITAERSRVSRLLVQVVAGPSLCGDAHIADGENSIARRMLTLAHRCRHIHNLQSSDLHRSARESLRDFPR